MRFPQNDLQPSDRREENGIEVQTEKKNDFSVGYEYRISLSGSIDSFE